MDNPKRILVAPLNWGLGHATRCIPIVEALRKQGAEVLLASDGVAMHLLEKEFPELPLFELPSYRIRYSHSNMTWNMMLQLPRMLMAIWREQRALRKIVAEYGVEIVLSDNRYGCYSANTYNVFLTHQLHILVPFKPLQVIVRQINHWYLKRFSECWIPDCEQSPNLSGVLSHPAVGQRQYFLGLLSRMQRFDCPRRYDLAIVLSGPEPQRSYLEQKIITQLSQLGAKQKILLVQGDTTRQERKVEGNIETISFLTSRDLNEAMLSAELVLCRSGYSSLMDLVKLEVRALLIPTPGQTEQEYLADYLMQQGVFYSVAQENLHLAKDIEKAKTYPGFAERAFPEGALEERITDLLS